jgi:hypothetical protein
MTSSPFTRADRNNNPAAFTTAVAYQAGLKLGTHYLQGDKFPGQSQLYTAQLLGDPVPLTIRVIDKITYYTKAGTPRWEYIAIPTFIWDEMSYEQKRDIIGFHYLNEGGKILKDLFPRWGQR